MLITLRPGVAPDTARKALLEIGTAAGNLKGGTGSPLDPAVTWLLKYLEWATDAARRLGPVISAADLDRLVLTRRYYALLDGAGRFTGNEQARLVNGLISLELTERATAFEDAVKALDGHRGRWGSTAWLAVADSSFYLNSPRPLGETDLHQVLHLPTGHDIHLLFPIAVVEELDRLKETGREHPRWRAGHTLGQLNGAIHTGTTGTLHPQKLLNPQTGEVRGKITAEIVLDQPGHVRLPIADDEIIDRAAAIKAIAGADVRFLTCDTGQEMRARVAGLTTIRLPHSAGTGDEPPRHRSGGGDQPRGNGLRAQQKNRRDAEASAAAAAEPATGG